MPGPGTTADIAGASAPLNRRPLVRPAERAPGLSVMIRLDVDACDEGVAPGRDAVFATARKSGLHSGSQKGIISEK
jgi:hypothetical protein